MLALCCAMAALCARFPKSIGCLLSLGNLFLRRVSFEILLIEELINVLLV